MMEHGPSLVPNMLTMMPSFGVPSGIPHMATTKHATGFSLQQLSGLSSWSHFARVLICIGWISGSDVGHPRVFWLLTHASLGDRNYTDQQRAVVETFNDNMSLATGAHSATVLCQRTPTCIEESDICLHQRCNADEVCHMPNVDLFTPTVRLIEQLPHDAANMTHDAYHWSRTVNAIFAQMLLDRLLQSRSM